MKLFLLRHAQAKETFPDEERELTNYGIEQIIKLTNSVSHDIFNDIAQLWHSPFKRTKQTANLFAQNAHINAPILESSEITPCAYPQEVARMIAGLSCFGADLLIVSHNPLLESLTTILLGKSDGYITFKTSTIACISMIEAPNLDNKYGQWSLEFLISPEIISK